MSGFKRKKEKYKHKQKILHHLSLTFFEFSSSLHLEYSHQGCIHSVYQIWFRISEFV